MARGWRRAKATRVMRRWQFTMTVRTYHRSHHEFRFYLDEPSCFFHINHLSFLFQIRKSDIAARSCTKKAAGCQINCLFCSERPKWKQYNDLRKNQMSEGGCKKNGLQKANLTKNRNVRADNMDVATLEENTSGYSTLSGMELLKSNTNDMLSRKIKVRKSRACCQ